MKTNPYPSSSPENPETDQLKTGVVKDILKIEDEELLAKIFEFICSYSPDDGEMQPVVRESASFYGMDVRSLKLSIIARIIETDNRDYLDACVHFIRRIVRDMAFRNGLDEALEDIKMGRVYRADSVKDMFKDILGE